MSALVITIRNLVHKYGENVAVNNLTLEVEPGEIFGSLGHNDAGKTTTVRLQNGLLRPASEDVRGLGLRLQQDGPALRSRTGRSVDPFRYPAIPPRGSRVRSGRSLFHPPSEKVELKMNWRAVFAIVRKDLKVVLQNKGVLLPIIIIPLVFFVALPWLAALAPRLLSIAGVSFGELDQLIVHMPAGFQANLAGYTQDQKVIVLFLVYMLAPLFLIIPLMVASVIAADSVAGERERKTLEALLYSPTTDLELFAAKLLSVWLPAVGVALVGFLLYAIMANMAGWPVMGQIFLPIMVWLTLVLCVVPAVAGLSLGVMVLVFVKAQGFQDAYQVGSMVVIPILLLVFGQISGIMVFSVPVVMLLGLGIWLLDVLLLWLGRRAFQRGRLIVRA